MAALRVPGETQAAELPAAVGMEEVAIGRTGVPVRGHSRAAAQDHLIDHEFSIVFADGTGGRPEARIRAVSGTRPLPHMTCPLADLGGWQGRFPFRLGWQAGSRPVGEG